MSWKKVLIFLLPVVALILGYVLVIPVRPAATIDWGVSFSKGQAESLGLDWRETYRAMLDDLQVSHIRLSSYWNEIEPEVNIFRFGELDYMINQAASRGRSILLVVGRRQPRWPECHIPAWAEGLSMEEQNAEVLEFVTNVIERYRSNDAIIAWQVENEFYLDSFGDCPAYDKKFLDREIAAVRALDARPIVITDSGELSPWLRAGLRADVLGVSMYRTVLNPKFGYITYPHPPGYYSRFGKLVKLFTRYDRLIVSELQMEPWGNPFIGTDSTEENYKSFPPERFAENIEYASKSGVNEVYLWGVEWWYFMKEEREIATFWDEARGLWKNDQ